MLFRILTAWLCNLFDIISTLYFFTYFDGDELNPISAALLQYPPMFVAVKLLSMSIAVVFIWIKRDWTFCKVVSWALFVEYLLVAIYYIIAFVMVAYY